MQDLVIKYSFRGSPADPPLPVLSLIQLFWEYVSNKSWGPPSVQCDAVPAVFRARGSEYLFISGGKIEIKSAMK